jgi:hypothetical protein
MLCPPSHGRVVPMNKIAIAIERDAQECISGGGQHSYGMGVSCSRIGLFDPTSALEQPMSAKPAGVRPPTIDRTDEAVGLGSTRATASTVARSRLRVCSPFRRVSFAGPCYSLSRSGKVFAPLRRSSNRTR